MKSYAVVIESGPKNYSAYVSDLPGCIATGKTLNDIKRNVREVGDPLPEPSSRALQVEVNWAA